jgi:hypothetical protein
VRRRGPVIEVVVQVPAGLPVTVTDSSGDVRVTGVKGEVRVP